MGGVLHRHAEGDRRDDQQGDPEVLLDARQADPDAQQTGERDQAGLAFQQARELAHGAGDARDEAVVHQGDQHDAQEEHRQDHDLEAVLAGEALGDVARQHHQVAGDVGRHDVIEADEGGGIDPAGDKGEQDDQGTRHGFSRVCGALVTRRRGWRCLPTSGRSGRG